MSDLSLIKDVKDAANTILTGFKDFIGLKNARSINDFNRAVRQNELTLYTLASENVQPRIYGRIAHGIELQVVSAIRVILSQTLAAHPEVAQEFLTNNFTNNDDSVTKLRAGVRDMTDSLSESGVVLEDLDIVLEEGTSLALTEKLGGKPQTVQKLWKGYQKSQPILTGKELNDPTKNKALNADFRRSAHFGVADSHNLPDARDSMRVPGSMHTVVINYIDGSGRVNPITLSIYVRVRIIPVEAEQLLSAMSSAKKRGMFQNYLNYRAGLSDFFKGFILNLKEIEKQVKRDTSKNLTERILGSLLTKGGFTRPKMLGEISEFKNYSIVITSDDADRLQREHDLNLTRPGSLKQVFANMNILSLYVVDEAKQRVTIFESDRPTEMTVVTIADLSDEARLANIFQSLSR